LQLVGEPVAAAAEVIPSSRNTLGLSQLELLRRIEALEAQLARLAADPNLER
jgi:hypothetical protein